MSANDLEIEDLEPTQVVAEELQPAESKRNDSEPDESQRQISDKQGKSISKLDLKHINGRQVKVLLPHSLARDCLAWSLIIYGVGRDFKLKSGKDLGKLKKGDVEKFDTGELRQELLLELKKRTPDVELKFFIDESVEGHTTSDLQAGIAVDDQHELIIVSFRGTEGLKWRDWRANMKGKLRELSQGVKVHEGFQDELFSNDGYRRLKNEVIKLLKEDDQKRQNYHVISTGHSQGGALCTLFGYLMAKNLKKKSMPQHVIVVSFASPRLGNLGWRKAFDDVDNLTHYRISNNGDIVTAFPPSFTQRHVGFSVCIRKPPKKKAMDRVSPDFFPEYTYSWLQFSILNNLRPSRHLGGSYDLHLELNEWTVEQLEQIVAHSGTE